jgi:hypothetical protein
METIYQYCKINIDNINAFDQPGFKWKKKYLNDTFKEIEGILALEDFTDEIKRLEVLTFFNNGNYYYGFLSALIWGGISTRPSKGHKGNKLTSNAYKVLSLPKDIVLELTLKIKSYIEDKEYEKAYNILAAEHKIKGLNVSFFSKLLYFISESINTNLNTIDKKFNLLIYDKWTKVLHLLLLLEADEKVKIINFFGENYMNKFFANSIEGNITNLVYCKDKYAVEAYLDYCIKINLLAEELSKNSNKYLSPGHLEAFLFGLPKKLKNNIVSNNRLIIRRKIKEYVSSN